MYAAYSFENMVDMYSSSSSAEKELLVSDLFRDEHSRGCLLIPFVRANG